MGKRLQGAPKFDDAEKEHLLDDLKHHHIGLLWIWHDGDHPDVMWIKKMIDVCDEENIG